MYHSRFFFFRLASALSEILKGARLMECYSQQKDELLLQFYTDKGKDFFIRADLSAGASILSFPEDPARSRTNSVALFSELNGQVLKHVEPQRYDRLFSFHFESGLILTFKMYGQRSNIILHQSEKVVSVFNHHLRKDLELVPAPAKQHPEEFIWHPDPEILASRCPGFTKRIRGYWHEISQNGSAKESFQALIDGLTDDGPLFLCQEENEVFVSFFSLPEVLFESSDSIEISNRFYRLFWQVNCFGWEKEKLIQEKEKQLAQVLDRIEILQTQVERASGESAFRLHADLLMAYGHEIQKGSEKAVLPAFDDSGLVEIRLKKDLSIPENAERLYRKARGQAADLQRLLDSLNSWKNNASSLRETLSALSSSSDLRGLRKLNQLHPSVNPAQEEANLPFWIFSFMNYEIRVGKNAKGNDELLRISHKDDHWLHARDVPGSHVLVRRKKGQNTPQPVLERAAELAAYHSRARNESLSPVMLTERKYVRKVKGLAAGQVRVEKEKTLLVKPKI